MQPFDFACAMQAHWTKNLNNTPSSALMSLWVVMAQTFNSAIELSNTDDSARNLWRVLQPPTGSGKTQGIRIYSAMTAIRNAQADLKDRVGILIVTREIEEADKLAAQINASFVELGGEKARIVALARHSRSPVGREDMRRADVLVITHAAYVRALDRLQQDDDERWAAMIEWEAGRRRLTVVDETIANLVESYQLNIETLKVVKGYISEDLRRRHPQQMVALDAMEDTLRRLQASRIERAEAQTALGLTPRPSPEAVVWGKDNRWRFDATEGLGACSDMSGLRAAMLATAGNTELPTRRKGVTESTPIAKLADDTLKAVELVLGRWAYYANHGDKGDTLNTSRLILPDVFPGPVVLDATASQDVLLHLLGRRVHREGIPKGVRDYRNMTLHVAFARGLGKRKMFELRKDRVPRLLDHLNSRFAGQQRKTLVVCHKDVEPEVRASKHTFGQLSTAHWGAIDGRNDWEQCDTAVIFGLSFRDDVWANNLFLAINDHNGQSPELGRLRTEGDETFRDLQRRQLTVGIVQAINRIRCRRVVDTEGNCPPAEAFLLLPSHDNLGQEILDAIRVEMPGDVLKDWDFDLDQPGQVIRQGSSHERLVEFVRAMKPGRVALSALRAELGLSKEGMKHVAKLLRDAASPLARSLHELGVTYSKDGLPGREAAFLLKVAT